MARPPTKLDLASGQELIVPPNGPLPKFYPPPRGIKIIPIYDDERTFPWSHHEYRPQTSERERSRSRSHSRSHRRDRSKSRVVYTDSEYSHSGSYVSSSRTSSHGRGRSPLPSERYREDRYEEPHRGHSRSRYTASEVGAGSLHHHHQNDRNSDFLYNLHHGRRPESVAPSGRSGSTVRGHRYGSRSNSDIPDIRNFLEDVQKYLKILPPAKDFCYSRCTGRKKAVCIGINYVGQKDELRGCANDARNMRKFIMDNYGFQSQDILLIVDDGHANSSLRPTRKEMFNAMRWLVKGAQMHDSLFFHYSGHGGQSPDASGREADGMDEVIYPVDYDSSGDIIDDELHQELVAPLPPGCRLTVTFRGTVLDLPYLHSAHGRLRGLRHVSKRCQKRGVAPGADVISFSACKDDETSADTFSGGVATGAMSHAFVQSLEGNPNQTYEELLQHLRDILIPKYHQKAQLSGTHPIDLNRTFIL
ncbi:Metacaspase-1 [Psilocybe cubensis]|uniref:Metacaspase-1 n=2 Tax=Psilocybe cubensis TaxID=181762 RepID=A0ACB8GMD1_PSICU|nr:Metacaspase-1 [Psilocybe cubensis]KAH9476366.1 Metacaspase-1 [Psilocybe cubensis]